MKQFYKSTLIAAALLLTVQVYAQQSAGGLTLEQCIQYALEKNVEAQNAILDQRIAAAKVKETIGYGLPQINGNGSAVYNQKLSRFFIQYNPDGAGFIDLGGVPGIQPGDVVAAQNFFQLKSNANASVSIDQLIFNGSYIVGLQASNTYKELANKSALRTQEQIVQGVIKAYYAVLINRERTELFTDNIARVDSLYRNTKALNENGFAESIDVDRVKVSLNNLRAERDNFANLNDLGIQLLKFQMNFPLGEDLIVAGNIQEVKLDTSLTKYSAEWDYKNRPDYQVLDVNYRLQQLNVKNQYAGGMPSISAFANFGMGTQSPNVGGLFSTNSSIKDEGGIGPDKWYPATSFGVSLHVPIFTGLQRTYRIQQEKLTLQKIENSFTNLRNGIDLEITQATIMFKNSLKTLYAQKENQDLASNVARVTKIKYEQGVGTNLEVVDAENALRTAQTNYYSALFDAMIAKVNLEKAYGRLLPMTNVKEN